VPLDQPQSGFTLLELVIAMTLLGLITVMMASALQLGARALEAGDERAETANRIRVVQGFLRRQLGQARPVQWEQATGESSLVFEGQPQELRFVASPPTQRVWGGLQLVTLEAEQTETGERLILSYRMLGLQREAPLEPEQGERVLLFERLDQLEFSYLGRRSPDEPVTWHDQWQSTYGFPRLVRLRAKLREGGQADWPELVVALHGE
jgi:general secretion pathway protein J